MPEPERSIEELVEDLTVAAIGFGGCTKQGCHQHEGELAAARDTLLRAVARLREENEGFRRLAGGYVRVAPHPEGRGP